MSTVEFVHFEPLENELLVNVTVTRLVFSRFSNYTPCTEAIGPCSFANEHIQLRLYWWGTANKGRSLRKGSPFWEGRTRESKTNYCNDKVFQLVLIFILVDCFRGPAKHSSMVEGQPGNQYSSWQEELSMTIDIVSPIACRQWKRPAIRGLAKYKIQINAIRTMWVYWISRAKVLER